LEEVCLNLGIPYKIYGGTRFYDRKEIKDLLAFLRLILNPKDTVSIERLGKLGKRRGAAIMALIAKIKPEGKPQEVPQLLLKETPYLELFDEHDAEDTARIENIQELVNVAYSYETLREFLDSVALIESGYELENLDGDKLNLMTMHAAKGLEFGAVFIVGAEEGIIPHSRSINSLSELEEERRLFYVGITRAKRELYITFANKRTLYGRTQYNMPSQFLNREESEEF
jgi:DNA helicase-2/ATP-dependent DNA helicase PcrA